MHKLNIACRHISKTRASDKVTVYLKFYIYIYISIYTKTKLHTLSYRLPVIWLALVSPPWMFSASSELDYLRCSSINKLRNLFSSSTSWKKENTPVHQNLPAPTSPSSSLLIHLSGPWRSEVRNSTIGSFCDAASLMVSLHCHADTRAGPSPCGFCSLAPSRASPAFRWSELSNNDASHHKGMTRPSIGVTQQSVAAGTRWGAKHDVFDPVLILLNN